MPRVLSPRTRRSLWVHHLVKCLTDGWEPIIPGTGLPIIKRVFHLAGVEANGPAERYRKHGDPNIHY